MLMHFDPFRDLDRLTRNVTINGRQPWMAMDAYRLDDHVMLQFDLPGADPASVDVTFENGTLTITAERRPAVAEDGRVLVSERPQGTLTRRLTLGENLDGDRTAARYDNGVLTITVPVAEQSKPRKVEVVTAGQSPTTTSEPVAA
ncbi:MAG TPA: Hsp20/alpha crystallin family protein [Acidimicrobiales bacterium]|nr:Hsp20/alpha crystallin family protein [Acidimicrobiales bacterium]